MDHHDWNQQRWLKSDEDGDVSPYQLAGFIACTVSGTLSFVGSLAIVLSSYKQINSVYQRLIFMVSVCDIVSSLSVIFHPYMLPEYLRDLGMPWAAGTQKSCQIAAFFFVLGPMLVAFYSFYLTLFFYVKIRYPRYYNNNHQTLEETIIAWYQWPFHILAFAVSFIIAGVGFHYHGYKYRTYMIFCFLAKQQFGEMNTIMSKQENIPYYLFYVTYSILLLLSLGALVCTFGIYGIVRQALKQSEKYQFQVYNHSPMIKSNGSCITVTPNSIEDGTENDEKGISHENFQLPQQERNDGGTNDEIGDQSYVNPKISKDEENGNDQKGVTFEKFKPQQEHQELHDVEVQRQPLEQQNESIEEQLQKLPRQQEQQHKQEQCMAFGSSNNNSGNMNLSNSSLSRVKSMLPKFSKRGNMIMNRNCHAPVNKRLLEVRNQAILFALAYWNSFIWVLILMGLESRQKLSDGVPAKVFKVLLLFFFPLQGFINFIIYTRPRYLEYRKNRFSKWNSFYMALTLQPCSVSMMQQQRERITNSNEMKSGPQQSEIVSNVDNGVTMSCSGTNANGAGNAASVRLATKEDDDLPYQPVIVEAPHHAEGISHEPDCGKIYICI